MKILRPHQTSAIELLRASLIKGAKRPILTAPTGCGKTLIATKIIANAQAKGKRVMFVVDAVELIDQTVNAFYSEGLHSIGVIQAQHPLTDYSKQLQIASVQTLARRTPPAFDLCIIDEAHSVFAMHRKLMEDNPTVPFIGLSATPWAKGMGLLYDDLIQPASIAELTELGYVARLAAYAPSHPDLTGVSVKAGEYEDEQLSKVMQGEKLVADIVDTWKRLGENRPTLCFCVDRAHAAAMQERFQREWIGCGYIDGDTPKDQRKAIRRQLEADEIKIVVSVGTMIKGVDWKFGCVIDAQPTRSKMRHVQKLGRLRPFPEWPEAIVLDHSDNILRLGLPIDIHRDTLCTAKKGEKDEAGEAQTKYEPKPCPKCSQIKPAGMKVCPCGFEFKVQAADIEEGAGTLARIDGKKEGPKKQEATPAEKDQFYRELRGWAALHGKEPRQADGKFKSRFGHWPARKHGLEPIQPSPETLSWITAQNIRWSKSQRRTHP